MPKKFVPEVKAQSYVSPLKYKHPLEIFLLARTGMKRTRIAQTLKVSKNSLAFWIDNYEEVKRAYNLGVAEGPKAKAGAVKGYQDYVYNNLPAELKPLWSEIIKADESGQSDSIANLVGRHKLTTRQRQYLFLHALVVSNFNATEASRKTGLSYRTWLYWREDPKFEALCKQIHQMRKDFIESQLMRMIAQDEVAAVIFANKTLNADRGYGTKAVVEHTGKIDHAHGTQLSFEQVLERLPLKLQRQILQCLRGTKPAALPAHRDVEVDPPEPEDDVIDADYEIKEKL